MNGSGTRSSLMYETLRIVEKIRPRYVIWENVKNLLSKKHKHNFDKYLDTMEKLGYRNYYQVLNAKDYGIPQNRERVFTISRLDGWSYKFPEKQELKLRLKDMLESNVDEKYYLSDKQVERMTTTTYVSGQAEKRIQNEVCRTLTARDWKDPKCVRIGGLYDTESTKHQAGSVWDKEGLAPTIETMQGGNRQPLIQDTRNLKEQLCDKLIEQGIVHGGEIVNHSYTTSEQRDTLEKYIESDNGIMPTMTTRPDTLGVCVKNANKHGYDIAKAGDSVNLQQPNSETRRGRVGHEVAQTLQTSASMGTVDEQLRIRKLTPCECWRLMGFNDDEFYKAEKVNSNSQLYKQAGNSIVVNVLEKILKNLIGEEYAN